jgi:hypothetical protein
MESEGPYKSERWECQNEFVITGPGWEFVGGTYTKNEADLASRFANLAYAEGRKSMEKDFKELLEMMKYVVDRIGDSGQFGQMHALEKLMAWKKARGIE